MQVFLDLEETLVNSWNDPILCNVQKLTSWFRKENVTEVHLFSFAVWDEKDRQHFVNNLQGFLENAFNVKFVTVSTVEDFMKADTKVTGIRFIDLTEFITIRGKVGAFQSWCKLHFPQDATCFLFDDVVPNMTIEDHDNRTALHFVNVVKFKGV